MNIEKLEADIPLIAKNIDENNIICDQLLAYGQPKASKSDLFFV